MGSPYRIRPRLRASDSDGAQRRRGVARSFNFGSSSNFRARLGGPLTVSEYGYVKVNLRLVGAARRIVGLGLHRHWGWGLALPEAQGVY